MSRKLKHPVLMGCTEVRRLFQLLGRHRAIKELNKAKPMSGVKEFGLKEQSHSIMDNIAWSECEQGPSFWAALYQERVAGDTLNRKSLLKRLENGKRNTR